MRPIDPPSVPLCAGEAGRGDHQGEPGGGEDGLPGEAGQEGREGQTGGRQPPPAQGPHAEAGDIRLAPGEVSLSTLDIADLIRGQL